ncbi:MAG: hypothetical protein WC179_06740 [Candidatus Cloacimonadaceae bacterium]
MQPLPNSITIERRRWTENRQSERFERWETIATGVPALISPAAANIEIIPGGPLENLSDTIFLEAGTNVEYQDRLIDEDTNEVWLVVRPPRSYKNPVTWEEDHIEVAVVNQKIADNS